MVFLYYIPVFFCLTSCVSADSWDDFANNLATDLAPLITLFGEQITRQCMSELVSTLDDFIFALVPLGVLTAVVSVIRVCGNSTLRAIIGRAQEDPASSEREILSCVSDSTAEIFTQSGVARITGNPRILEIVADHSQAQSGVVNVQKLSEVAGKAWTDLEKDAKLPNLSLNKGIRRRAPFWFRLAATFGVSLQLSIIIYAALTVMCWPQAFLKDGSHVDSYAFPMFVLGTVLLTLGMFLCAVLVERRSMKRIFDLPDGNRVYWIQPGNQTAGDQKFPSFVGRTEKGVSFIRSVRHDSPNNLLNIGREMELMLVVGLTMIGFVIQFVGIRGLHSSVSLAQLGATMVMTLVRTGLRAERMQEGDNMLKDDQDIVSRGEHELDWLLFRLFNIKSLRILPVYDIHGRSSHIQPDPIIHEPLITRVRLKKLAGSDWDETPVRKLAQNLGQATQELLKLVNSWCGRGIPYFEVAIPIEIQKQGNQQASSDSWHIRLHAEKEVDVDFWDALIGLYAWSIKLQNVNLVEGTQQDLAKPFNPNGKDAHQARLLYRKWTNDDSVLEHNHLVSLAPLKGCEAFCALRSPGGVPIPDRPALIKTSSDYYTLAVQDIYVHILHSMLDRLSELGGTTQIIGHDKGTYRFCNDRIDNIVESFISAGLGDRREGMVCILPVLYDRGLLPESTYDSVEVRRHMQKLEKLDNNEVFTVSEWLCFLAEHGEIEHVMAEYGYICLRNLMDRDDGAKSFALERIVAMLKADDGSLPARSISTYLTDIASAPSEIWCKNYRSQLYWITSRILQFQPIGNHFPRARLILQDFEKLQPIIYELNEVYDDEHAATLSQTILLNSWFELDFGEFLSDEHTRMLLDWLFKNRHDNILEWFVIRMITELSPNYSHDNMKELLSYATSKGYQEAVEIMWRHIDRFNIRQYLVEALASDGDVRTLENILGRDFSGHSTTDHESGLLKAAEGKQPAVIKYLLMGGVDVDAQNREGRTALMIAAKEGDFESIALLRSYNASLDIRDNSGDTALIQAVAHGHANIVEFLIQHGADVNTRDLGGRTLLILATLSKNLTLIKYLCDHGADINAADDSQINAVDVAERGDTINGPWTEGYAFLSSRGAKPNVAKRIGDTAYS